MLSARRCAALAVVIVLPLAVAGAQDLVAECVNGAPSVPAGIAADANAAALLDRLSWSKSYADYAQLVAVVGPVATFDSIAQRGKALLEVSGDLSAYSVPQQALEWRLAVLRQGMAPLTMAAINAGSIPSYSALAVSPTLTAGQITFVRDAAGVRTTLVFDAAKPVPAIALCAIARTTTNYLAFLSKDAFQKVADDYARAVKHWNTYIEQGYSMTLIERLGNSCRLGPFNWVVAPTVAGRCSEKPWKTLGPPAVRTIFVHPSAGLAPVFDSSSTARATSVTEWYGFVWTPFSGDKILPFGASVATMFPQTGRPQIGGMVHTPYGKVGVFRSGKSVNDRRGRVVIMADLVGWVPGNRAETGKQLTGLLVKKVGQVLVPIAKP